MRGDHLHLGLLMVGCMALAGHAEAKEWYVAPAGVDQLDGGRGLSVNQPLATINFAAQQAQAGDTVYIRGGTYRETVTPAHSGTAAAPITFKPYQNEAVIINGTDVVSGAWSVHKGSIYQIDLAGTFTSTLNQAEQLFVDGKMVTWAQTPNDSGDLMRPARYMVTKVLSKTFPKNGDKPNGGYGTFEFTSADLKDTFWKPGDKIWSLSRDGATDIGGGWGFGMSGTILEFTPPDAGKPARLKVQLPLDNGDAYYAVAHFDSYSAFYLMGHLNALDTAGEWFHDTAAGKLYLWAPASDSPAGHTIEIKRRDYAFNLSGLSYVTIDGLQLFGCTITTDTLAGNGSGNGIFGGLGNERNGSKVDAPAHDIVLNNLHARYVSHFTDQTGNGAGQWLNSSGLILSGVHHTLSNSIIEYSAGNGVALKGRNHVIRNNVIHDVNYKVTPGAAICMGYDTKVYDVEIANNTLYNATNALLGLEHITSSDAKNPLTRVHHNYLSNAGTVCWDVGAIRTVGYDQAGNNTRFDHNVIRDVTGKLGFGIYLDTSKGFVIDHNFIYNARSALNLNSGVEHLVYNNTLIGTRFPVDGNKQTNVKVHNNLVSGMIGNFITGQTEDHNLSRHEGVTVVDAWDGDGHLPAHSPAIHGGVSIPPFTDGATDGKVDVGAYQFGQDWTAGSSLPLPINPPTNLSANRSGAAASSSWLSGETPPTTATPIPPRPM